jgi:hypothetical protein
MCGIDTLVASTLPDNHEMLGVFTHSRFDASMHFDGGVISVRMPISPSYRDEGESC